MTYNGTPVVGTALEISGISRRTSTKDWLPVRRVIIGLHFVAFNFSYYTILGGALSDM